MPRKAAATPEPLEPLIREIRGERVILDSDPARLHGVEARGLSQAVKRNPEHDESLLIVWNRLKDSRPRPAITLAPPPPKRRLGLRP